MIKYMKKIRRENGQVALEMIAVMFAWFMAVSLFFNLLFFFGSTMIMDSYMNRAVVQIGAFGCLPQGNTEASTVRGLGVLNPRITYQPVDGPLNDAYYSTDPFQTVHSPSTDLAGTAACDANNTPPNRAEDSIEHGRYIMVQLRYTQNLWIFGTRTVRRNAVTVSSGLEKIS